MKKFTYLKECFSEYEKITEMPTLYVLTTTDLKYMKIGIAKNVKQRMSNIQSGCPFNLSLYLAAHIPNTREVEIYLHGYFKEKNTRGEWFSLNFDEIGKLSDFFFNINRSIKESFGV